MISIRYIESFSTRLLDSSALKVEGKHLTLAFYIVELDIPFLGVILIIGHCYHGEVTFVKLLACEPSPKN